MPPSPFLTRLVELTRRPPAPAPVTARPDESDACACCRLARDEHGVQLIHRFVPPGQPVATW